MSPTLPRWSVALTLSLFGCGESAPPTSDTQVAPRGFVRCGANPAGTFCDASALWGARATVTSTSAEGLTGALTSADFDSDGRPDLLAVYDGDAAPALWLNTPGGFTDHAASWGLSALRSVNSAASADLDGDGRPDLMLHSRDESGVILFRNTGTTFERVTALGGMDDVTTIAPADIDRDGRLDLTFGATAMPGDCPRVFISGCPAGVRAWRQTAPWTFAPIPVAAEARRALSIRWHDLDLDGRDELLVIADFGMLNGGNQVLRVEGQGDALTLREAPVPQGFGAEIFGMGVAPIDVDRDGRDELMISNFGRNLLLQRRGDAWVDVAEALGGGAYGIVTNEANPWSEFDPEHPWMGPLDGFQAQYLDPASPLAPTTKWTPLVFDYDHDGIDDVYLGAGSTGLRDLFPEPVLQSGAMLRGDGARLRDVTDAVRLGERHGAMFPVAADFDGDGDLDLALPRQAFPNHPGGVVFLRNDASAGRALWVEARGLAGARDGIGAQVTVTVGRQRHVRRLDGNYSIAGSGPHGVFVGLGTHASADSVEVRFVSGAVRRLTGVPAGRVVVRE
ncbi:MAG: CRTAC1 family protein [Polyangiales bacterium]